MKNEVSVIEQNIPALAMDESELLRTLSASVYPGAKPDSVRMVISWCRAQQKDPFKRPVHIVPMRVKNTTGEYEWRDVIMPGINDYRTDASRTAAFVGLSSAEFGPDKTLTLSGIEITFPEWCEITAYRIVGNQKAEFPSGKVRWLETYATAKHDSLAPNAMWKKRPYGQIEKCAEALALRRAFPEVGAQNTLEELEGKTLDGEEIDITPPKPEVKMPQAKQPTAPAAKSAPPAPADPDVIEGTAVEKASEPPSDPKPEPEVGGELVSDGAKTFLKRKLGERDPVAFAAEHGADWANLTVAGFNKLKAVLK